MYFRIIPKMIYTLDNLDSLQVVTDIFRRVKIIDQIRNNLSYFDEYDIRDGDTPEILADKLYGDTSLHWIILLVNEIIDPRFDWPVSQYTLGEYCKNKYGEANIYATHHFETADGIKVNSNYPGAVSISNFQFEDQLNEAKRRIKLVTPAAAAGIIDEFAALMNR